MRISCRIVTYPDGFAASAACSRGAVKTTMNEIHSKRNFIFFIEKSLPFCCRSGAYDSNSVSLLGVDNNRPASLLRILNQGYAFLFQEAAERLGDGVAPVEDLLSLRADDDAGGGRVDPVLLEVVAEDLEY